MANLTEKDVDSSLLKQSYLERSLQHITEEFVQKMRELSLIKRISDALVNAGYHQKVCLEITKIILDEINAEHCSLLLIEEQTDNLILKAVKSQEDSEGTFYELNSEIICKTDEGLADAIFQSGEPIYIKNLKRDRRFTGDPLCADSMLSLLFLPLISGENSIGLIKLDAPESNAFAKEDQNLLQIVANQVANVLRNVQLVKNLQESYQQQQKVLHKLKNAEKQLSQYSKELEVIVEERTNELVQSEKLAIIGQLVAGVAHELNNPLAIVMGYIDLLLSAEDMSKKFIPRLEKVHQATTRCANIVNNLLKFSQKGPLERKTVDINKVLEDTLDYFEYQFKVNNISLKKNLQEELPAIQGDPQQLQQVFLNLITNSYDALNQQNKKKILEVITSSDSRNVIIEFCDSGKGIIKEHRSKLFEPFFTTKEIGKGTGLGLSLSYGIVREHEGEIYLDPSYTKGAKFVIKFPIPFGGKKLNQKKDFIDPSTKILIVDDESDIISFQQDILTSYSLKTDIANSGEQALELVNKNDYDVIITDIKMPGAIGGIELYKTIKKTKPGLERRIIFTTGDTASKDTHLFLEEVDNYCLKKPFLLNDFINAVKRCLHLDMPR